MRTMTVIFTTLLIVASASVTETADETNLIGPPPAAIVEENGRVEYLGPPTVEPDERNGGGVRCLACQGR